MFSLTLMLDGDMAQCRDLANDIQEAVRRAQRDGRHPDVAVIAGPTLTQMIPLRALSDGKTFGTGTIGAVTLP